MHKGEEERAFSLETLWRLIKAVRNRLIHGYPGMDEDTLGSIIRDDVPELLPLLQKLKSEFHS